MKRNYFVLGILLFAAIGAIAQQSPVAPRPDSVTVSADGRFEAAPDTAVIQFNISAQEPVLKDAYTRAQNAAEQVRQVLRSNGIDPKQAEIGTLQVNPVYDYRNPKRKLVGYQVNSAISVKVKDFTKVGSLADAFSGMDVTANQSISYTLKNMEAARLRAAEDAMQQARTMAATLARSAGRTLGEARQINLDSYNVPGPRPIMFARAMNAEAAAPAPTAEFSPAKVTITARVTVEYALK